MERNDRNRNVVGIYRNAEGAQKAIEDLHALGYRTDDISVISRAIDDDRKLIEDMETVNDPNWSHGARPGGATGGVSGLLAGLGQLDVPGLGSVMAAGSIREALTAHQAGGRPLGNPDLSLGQLICGADAPKGDVDFVEERFAAGDIFVRVEAPDYDFARVAELLGDHRTNVPEEEDGPDLTEVDPADETNFRHRPDDDLQDRSGPVGERDPLDREIPVDPVDETASQD